MKLYQLFDEKENDEKNLGGCDLNINIDFIFELNKKPKKLKPSKFSIIIVDEFGNLNEIQL